MKRLLRTSPAQAIVGVLAALYIRMVYATSRWRMIGTDGVRLVTDGETPFIGCFWHGRMLMWPGLWTRRKPILMLVSDHQDGRLIARTIAHFGIDSVADRARAAAPLHCAAWHRRSPAVPASW